MTTHRYLLLFVSLAAGLVNGYAQPMVSMNAPTRSTKEASAEKAPRQPKAAVEAPFYVKLYGFYGLLTPGSQISTNVSANYSSGGQTNSTSFKTNSVGLGAGPRAGIGVGVIVSDFINLGVDVDMLFGASLETTNNYKANTYTSNSTTSTTFRVISITPNITFKALSRPAYYIYNRLGLIGGIVMDYKTNQNSVYTPATPTTSNFPYTTSLEYDFRENSLSIGYQAALGIQFRLSQSLRGFAEVVAYNQSFKPKERLYTYVYTRSGVAPTTTQSITQYTKEGDYTSSTKDGLNVSQAAAYNVVMNSVGLGAGLLVRF